MANPYDFYTNQNKIKTKTDVLSKFGNHKKPFDILVSDIRQKEKRKKERKLNRGIEREALLQAIQARMLQMSAFPKTPATNTLGDMSTPNIFRNILLGVA